MSGIGIALSGLSIVSKLTGAGNAAKGFLSAVPKPVWEAIAVLCYILAVLALGVHTLHRHDAAIKLEQKNADDAAWQLALNKERQAAALWKKGFDLNAAAISNDERKIHEQAVASNAAAADALRLRGPGAASATRCGQVDHPGASAAPDRHDQATPQASAPAAQVPSDDWAVVPWSWLVTVIQEHDDLLSDVKAVEDNDTKQRANWPSQVY